MHIPENEWPDPLPDEHLREIGRIVVSWNRLEQMLTNVLCLVLIEDMRTYERATAVFVHMAFPQKLDALSAMLQTIEEEFCILYRERVQPLIKQAQEKRNTTLHQFWFVEEGEVKRGDIKARGIIKISESLVSIQDLEQANLLIGEAYNALFTMIWFPLTFKFKPHSGQNEKISSTSTRSLERAKRSDPPK